MEFENEREGAEASQAHEYEEKREKKEDGDYDMDRKSDMERNREAFLSCLIVRTQIL